VLSSGTAFVTFENVMVPVENLIGDEGMGFLYIVRNFNHERWAIVAQCVRFARVCIEDALRWALKRKTFGKELIKHPVIRTKFADMIRQVEATQAWLEQVTHQLNVLPPEKQGRLAGSIALLKAHSSRVFEYCAREAQQILGGTGYTRGGQGERVERLARDVRVLSFLNLAFLSAVSRPPLTLPLMPFVHSLGARLRHPRRIGGNYA
jgi:alkylation response protein AidB-like acyl-CoA dehydrogenase